MAQSNEYYKSCTIGVMSEVGLTTDQELSGVTCSSNTMSFMPPRYRKSCGTSHYTTFYKPCDGHNWKDLEKLSFYCKTGTGSLPKRSWHILSRSELAFCPVSEVSFYCFLNNLFKTLPSPSPINYVLVCIIFFYLISVYSLTLNPCTTSIFFKLVPSKFRKLLSLIHVFCLKNTITTF